MSDKKFADKIESKEGNTYYRWPQWFKEMPDGTLVMCEEMPDDLATFVCRAGLGNPEYKIERHERQI